MDQRQPGDRLGVHARAGDVGQRRRQDQLGVGALQVPAEPAHRAGPEGGRGRDRHRVGPNLDGDPGHIGRHPQHRHTVQLSGSRRGRVRAHADAHHPVAGPRRPVQVGQQFADGLAVTDRNDVGHHRTLVAAAEQPAPPHIASGQQAHQTGRKHQDQIAAREVQVEQEGPDSGQPEHAQRRLDDPLVLGGAVPGDGSFPAARPVQRDEPADDEQRGGRQERQVGRLHRDTGGDRRRDDVHADGRPDQAQQVGQEQVAGVAIAPGPVSAPNPGRPTRGVRGGSRDIRDSCDIRGLELADAELDRVLAVLGQVEAGRLSARLRVGRRVRRGRRRHLLVRGRHDRRGRPHAIHGRDADDGAVDLGQFDGSRLLVGASVNNRPHAVGPVPAAVPPNTQARPPASGRIGQRHDVSLPAECE